jgi:two-component system copper resistance phosphate regulon response regulator CusR
MRILVVDDDPRTRDLLAKGLAESGHEALQAANGEEALAAIAAAAQHFDLVLLDVMMPVLDGWQTIARLRSDSPTTPVIMLSARQELHERVQGLTLGADDYLVKPFAWSELLARIDAVGRRTQSVRSCGDLEIDLRERHVRCGSVRIELSPREFAVLDHLARAPGQVVPRKQLLHDVWGIDFDPDTNLVDVTVSRLRRRLLRSRTVRIVAEPGQGYRLQLVEAADAPA